MAATPNLQVLVMAITLIIYTTIDGQRRKHQVAGWRALESVTVRQAKLQLIHDLELNVTSEPPVLRSSPEEVIDEILATGGIAPDSVTPVRID